jgi:hypothetical protein
MPELGTSGSEGGRGGKLPRPTRPLFTRKLRPGRAAPPRLLRLRPLRHLAGLRQHGLRLFAGRGLLDRRQPPQSHAVVSACTSFSAMLHARPQAASRGSGTVSPRDARPRGSETSHEHPWRGRPVHPPISLWPCTSFGFIADVRRDEWSAPAFIARAAPTLGPRQPPLPGPVGRRRDRYGRRPSPSRRPRSQARLGAGKIPSTRVVGSPCTLPPVRRIRTKS